MSLKSRIRVLEGRPVGPFDHLSDAELVAHLGNVLDQLEASDVATPDSWREGLRNDLAGTTGQVIKLLEDRECD